MVELMHILMDSSFLPVEFSDVFSQAIVGGSNTECIAFKPTNKQEADEDEKEQYHYLGRSGMSKNST